ncbi:MAG: peptide deformylase [Paracoccaceae bacterium]
MIRNLIKYPDPLLRSLCRPILEISKDVERNIRDLLDTLYDASGRGLAGPQIGFLFRIFVMDITWKVGKSDPKIIINPEILYSSNETQNNLERCLSIPNQSIGVVRPKVIELLWMDENATINRDSFSGISAAIICHEVDHLDGKLIIDKKK